MATQVISVVVERLLTWLIVDSVRCDGLGCGEEASVVLCTRATGEQVRSDARIRVCRVLRRPCRPSRRRAVRHGPVRTPTTTVEAETENLDGRVALVTGGGRGIGRAIALGLAATGTRVAVLARSADEVQETVNKIAERNQIALAVPADVTEPEEVRSALAKITDRWGPVEVLVNNAAAVWPLGPSAIADPDEWAAALAVNATAPARLSFNVLTGMLSRRWGRIVNVSSSIVANPAGMPRANAYVTSKTALEAHTINLAAELNGTGVTVNVFRPGVVDTAMQGFIRSQDPDQIGGELHQRFVSNHERGILFTPEQSASSLLSRLHGNSTGQIWDANDDLPPTEGNQR